MLYKRWWHYETFVVVVRMYGHILKHCTIVAPGTFRSTVWWNYVVNCLGKCLLKRTVVYC